MESVEKETRGEKKEARSENSAAGGENRKEIVGRSVLRIVNVL